MRGFSMSAYVRSRNAALRRQQRENERYWKNIHKLQEKQLREIRREEAKQERARLKAIKDAERKVKEAEKLAKLEAKIEARLRKEMNLKSGFTLEVNGRTLEPMEG